MMLGRKGPYDSLVDSDPSPWLVGQVADAEAEDVDECHQSSETEPTAERKLIIRKAISGTEFCNLGPLKNWWGRYTDDILEADAFREAVLRESQEAGFGLLPELMTANNGVPAWGLLDRTLDDTDELQVLLRASDCRLDEFMSNIKGSGNTLAICMLQNQDELIRDNDMAVGEAVKQNGRALLAASQRLRDDKQIVLNACQQNGTALEFASQRLQEDPEVIRAASANMPKPDPPESTHHIRHEPRRTFLLPGIFLFGAWALLFFIGWQVMLFFSGIICIYFCLLWLCMQYHGRIMTLITRLRRCIVDRFHHCFPT